MKPGDNVFKGEPCHFDSVDLEAPIQNAKSPACAHFSQCYRRAAEESLDTGNSKDAFTYAFLHVLTSFLPKFEKPNEPFGPWFQMEGKRGLLPSDLSISDISALKELPPLIGNHVLRAQLLDVQWLLTRKHPVCAEAAAAYLLAAEEQDTPENWIYAKKSYLRAGMLSGLLGSEKPLYKKLEESLIRASKNASADELGFRCGSFLKFILRFANEVPSEIGVIARAYAEKRKCAGDHRQARAYFRIEADFYQQRKDFDAQKIAFLKSGECYIAEAKERMAEPAGSALAASRLLIKGIEVLRLNGADTGEIAELRRLLSVYQRSSAGEMIEFSQEIDISDSVQSSRAHVQNLPFDRALVRLALGQPLTDLKALREMVLEMMDSAPLTHLFDTVLQDSSGRTLQVHPGIQGLDGPELEKRVEGEMFSTVSKFHWPLRVSGFIEPARIQIFNDHHPSLEDLEFIVRNNPFIPNGHQGIFLRGLHAGFQGDFLIASHLLVPQIENSIRYVLESQNIDVSNLMSDSTQPVKILGPLFEIPETSRFFGEGLCFELRGCLIEKLGYSFRNQLAHGFLSEGGCYSPPAIMIWWLVLRICAVPIFIQLQQAEHSENPSKP